MPSTIRGDLHAALIDAVGRCEWPQCGTPGDRLELAHLHSVGMGGRPSADTIDNVALLCWRHARWSDGLLGNTTLTQYRVGVRRLVAAAGRVPTPGATYAWEAAEALRTVIHRTRGWIVDV